MDAPWVGALARFLREERQVEAVMVDERHQALSLATVGVVDEFGLRARLRETLEAVQRSEGLSSDLGGILLKPLGERILLEKPCCPTAPRFWRWREMPWPEVEELESEGGEEWRQLAVLSGACAVLGITGFILERMDLGPSWLPLAFFGMAMVAGGWDAAKDVRIHLPKGKLDIHFLMLAVAVGAATIGAWAEGALLLFLFSLSGALEDFSLYRTKREVKSLFEDAPSQAQVLDVRGEEESLPVERVRPGDRIRVRPGDAFPLDGEVVEGDTAVDESNLTGEATPVAKGLGEEVFSGTLNLWGSVVVRVTRPVQESALRKIIRLIREAQHHRAPSQRFTDRFGTHYTIGVLGITFLMFFIWWLGFGVSPFTNPEGGFSAFYRSMTLLVVASPCALVLSIPSAILAAIARGARHGILFRGGAAIERLAEIDGVALDKTGTLTTGEMEVEQVESFPPGTEREVAVLAVSLESQSNHPIARAIMIYGKRNGIESLPVEGFRSLTGKGVQGELGGSYCVLGRRELMELGPLAEWVRELPDPDPEYVEVWVVAEGVLGRLLLRDQLREQSRGVLKRMSEAGLWTVMLTGDRRGAAERVGADLGLDEVRSGLSPEGKVSAIREWADEGRRMAMVGDGVNDAPCLAAAHVAVGMGARGSDSALEQSDVILMNDQIELFMEAFVLSRRARRIIRQNITVALGTVAVMVLATLAGIVPLSVGVLAHEGSTVAVCLNSLRLLFSSRS